MYKLLQNQSMAVR